MIMTFGFSEYCDDPAVDMGPDERRLRHMLDETCDALLAHAGGTLTATSMEKLTGDQLTLLAYAIFRREMMEGGMVQLIYNGYGPFIFLNPFAKAMRLWGLRTFSKFIYEGRALFEAHADEFEGELSDDDFMALYERYPEFEDLDDRFLDDEPEVTIAVGRYVEEHSERFKLKE